MEWKHANGLQTSGSNDSRLEQTWRRGRRDRHQPQLPSAAVSRYKKKLESAKQLANSSVVSLPTAHMFVPSLGFDLHGVWGTCAHKCLSLHHSCSKCLPNSRGRFIDKEYSGAGLRDLLTVDRDSVRGIFHWAAPLLGWSLQVVIRPVANPKKEALASPRVQAAINESAKLAMTGVDFSPSKPGAEPKIPANEAVAIKQQLARAQSILDTMSGVTSIPLVKLANYTMLWVLGRLFRHWYVQRSHVEMLKAAQEKNVPIVFLPCHKSHVDYILISVALINIGIKLPHIAAGDNLNIPVFSSLIRHLGGFFIRRKLDTGNTRDQLYRECLQEYIEQLLRQNQNLEIYIEGSRSRSGKPSLPKSGLMSFLVEAVRDGAVSDILLVPVGISYDRIVERNFVRHELMGGNKKPENFLKALGGVWRILTSDIGCVRLDFSQPFSIQEYLYSCYISQSSLLSLINSCPPSPNSGSIKRTSSDRRIITALSHHIVYDFIQTTTIMSTNIVGFLLLTRYRFGAKISQLINSYKWISDKVTSQGRALGFSGSSSEAVYYALCYLSNLVTYEDSIVAGGDDAETQRIVYAKLELPDVFQLSHHSNQLVALFMKESIIACSLLALQECKRLQEEDKETPDEHDSLKTCPVTISQDKLLEYALDLTKVIGREFIFAPPCIDIQVVLYEGIELLTAANVFKSTVSAARDRRLPQCSWDDDSEDEEEPDTFLEVVDTQESKSYISFLQSVLAPFIEGYWNVAVHLLTVWEQQQNKEHMCTETQFLHELQESMIAKNREGLLLHVECCSMDILRNALRSFFSLEVVTVNQDNQLYVLDNSQLLDLVDLLYMCQV